MPKYTDIQPFELPESFDEEGYLHSRIEEIRQMYLEHIGEIDKICDPKLQKLCLFSLIDSLAQAYSDYEKNNKTKDTFTEFVSKFGKEIQYLDMIEPVTLYYSIEHLIEDVKWLPELPPEPELSIDELELCDEMMLSGVLSSPFCDHVREYARKKLDVKTVEKLEKSHSVLSLLYQVRNKVTHELNDVGQEYRFEYKDEHTEPYYRNMSIVAVKAGKLVSYDTVAFVIPVAFVKTVFLTCLNNYLTYCADNSKDPFHKNKDRDVLWLSWYDKPAGVLS